MRNFAADFIELGRHDNIPVQPAVPPWLKALRRPDVGLEQVGFGSSALMFTIHFPNKDLTKFLTDLAVTNATYQIMPQTDENLHNDRTSVAIGHNPGQEEFLWSLRDIFCVSFRFCVNSAFLMQYL